MLKDLEMEESDFANLRVFVDTKGCLFQLRMDTTDISQLLQIGK